MKHEGDHNNGDYLRHDSGNMLDKQGEGRQRMTRLIDADALKNDLITFFPNKCLEGITTKTLFNQILTDINNAPTVEPQNKWGQVGNIRN